MNEREYSYLKKKIHELLRIDIDAYKSRQMRRRLEAFVTVHEPAGTIQFCRTLDRDDTTRRELKEMLTINVSEFFRDVVPYDYLKSTILPELLRSSPQLNIWTAGCSHGAEPYTLAILLNEMADARRHKILATDIDEAILKRAKAGGPYQPSEVRSVSKWRLKKYFTRSDDGYMVTDVVRKRVDFREHNLLSDPFESGFDLLVCRNVMIYFSNEVKERLFRQFCDSLRPAGVLFIGGAEALLGAAASLGLEKLSTSFYRKGDIASAKAPQRKAA